MCIYLKEKWLLFIIFKSKSYYGTAPSKDLRMFTLKDGHLVEASPLKLIAIYSVYFATLDGNRELRVLIE